MRLVTIKKEKLKAYTSDPEMLQKANRPCVLVLRLKFRGDNYTFAVPLRSNINPSTPKRLYFPLPVRSGTKDGYRHGLHYAKMFPIKKGSYEVYHTENNMYASIVKSVIDKNEKQIIRECQEYLNEYELGNIPVYSTNIDKLIKLI